MHIDHSLISLLGDRTENQDRAGICVAEKAALMMVFDGMGGHADGALAADLGLKVVTRLFEAAPKPLFDPQGFLYHTLAQAHDEIVGLGADVGLDYRPRATSAICLVQDATFYWAHIGDSRIYHVRDGRQVTRTRDHSHVEVLLQEGSITQEEVAQHPMRNFVECCLGGDAPVPDMTITRSTPLQDGDILLSCTDGFWSGFEDENLAAFISKQDVPLDGVLRTLAEHAIKTNAPYADNTTAAVVRYGD